MAELDPLEGKVAAGPNGQFLVRRDGQWFPSQEDGRPLERIPRPDYGANHFQLPNGDIVKVGPKGGQETIENFGSGGGASGGGVGADARGRYDLGAEPMTEALQRVAAEEAKGGNPLDRDWGAAILDGIGIDLPGDNDLRPFGPLARAWGGQDYQNLTQGLATYESSLMPIMSGAAVSASEARRMIRADFPAMGDSEETLKNKARNRMQRLNAIYRGLGKPEPYDAEQIRNADASAGINDNVPAGVAAATGAAGAQPPSSGDGLPSTPGLEAIGNSVFDSAQVVKRDGKDYYSVSLTPGQGAPKDLETRFGQDGQITAEEMQQAGYIPDQETGTWLYPVQAARLPSDDPTAAGAQGGAPAPSGGESNRADWTPEGAVEQRREMWSPLRNVDAAVRGAADIFSVEGADEAAAGADALFGQGNGDGFGERYANNLEVQRAIDVVDGEDVGFARRVGQGAGIVALASRAPQLLARNALVPVASQGARYAQLAGTGIRNALGGAGVGAAAGFLGAEEGESRLEGARDGGIVGAAAGLVAPVVGNALLRPIARRGQSVARFLGRQLGRAGEALDVPNSAALTRRATPNALDSAVDRFGERLGPVRSNALVDRANTMANENLSPTLIDSVDDGGQGLFKALGSRQTTARPALIDFARRRRVDAQTDASNLARQYVSPEARTSRQVADDLDIENRRLSGEEYATARAAPPITIDADTSTALWGPEGRTAMNQAARLYASSADPAERALASEFASMAALESAPRGGANMSVGAADLLARYLQRAGGSDQNAQRIFGGLGRAVRTAARNQSGEYDTAVSNFAERAQLEEGADLGRQFLGRGGTADFGIQANALSAPQRQMARVAARDAMEDRAATPAGAASLLDDLEIGLGRDIRAQGLLGPEDAAAMRQTAGQMRQRLQNGRNVDPRAGSNTNLNAQDSDVADGLDAVTDVVQATQLNLPAVSRLARRFRSRGFSDREAEALVEAAIDPARTAELITRLSTRMSRREARRLQRGITHGLAQSGATQ